MFSVKMEHFERNVIFVCRVLIEIERGSAGSRNMSKTSTTVARVSCIPLFFLKVKKKNLLSINNVNPSTVVDRESYISLLNGLNMRNLI